MGTVIHKVAAAKPEDHHSKEGVPFTFQQHWIGARDYVSSEEESEDASSADEKDSEPHLDLQVIMEACYAIDFPVAAWNGCVQSTRMLHYEDHFHHFDCCKLRCAVHIKFAATQQCSCVCCMVVAAGTLAKVCDSPHVDT